MTDARAMFALARPAFDDFLAIVRRRWWLIAGVAIAGAAWIELAQNERWNIEAAHLMLYLFWIVGVFWIFAEVMRIRWPRYAMGGDEVWRLSLVAVAVGLLWVLAMLPGLVVKSLHVVILGWVLIYVGDLLISTKLLFAFYATESEAYGGTPIQTSWRLTGGAAFWPTLLLGAIYFVAELPWTAWHGLIASVPLREGVGLVLILLLMTFFSPWKIRWMAALEEAEALCRDEAISA